MMTGEWIEGETLTRENYGENFISQLADLMAEVHTTKVPNSKVINIQNVVGGLILLYMIVLLIGTRHLDII